MKDHERDLDLDSTEQKSGPSGVDGGGRRWEGDESGLESEREVGGR